LKAAQTIDGKIADAAGVSKWISSEPSRKLVHNLRSEFDAVLVGRKTVENDNPQLTVRHIKGRNPYRIVMDKQLIPNLNSNLFSDEYTDRTIIVTSSLPDEFLKKLFEQRKIRVINAKLKDERIDLTDALKNISKTGIASILVEGGAYTYTEFIRQNAADELMFFISPRMMGKGIGTFSFEEQFSLKQFQSVSCGISGDDIVLTIKLK
jgi:diaminohydroxyphosphoribosylaminopyrimidine deaminase/5-amino-6-(5-phosphoribosylamino)uracil reductase